MRSKITVIFIILFCLSSFYAGAEELIKPYISVRDPRKNIVLKEPLPISKMDIAIRIHGCIAETAITMTFKSDYHDNLEGSFYFPLPEGSTVNGYALDIQGKMVEGVVVEKAKAQYIFETEVRRAIDPGLVEWAGGNIFRTRVYPIPPKGSRTIMIRYVSILRDAPSSKGIKYTYYLPLRTDYPVETVDVHIDAFTDTVPIIKWTKTRSLKFKKRGEKYHASTRFRDFTFKEDLNIVISDREGKRLWVERSEKDGEVYFVLQNPIEQGRIVRSVDALYVLWDASASAGKIAREQHVHLLKAVMEKFKPDEICIIPFRDQTDTVMRFEKPAGDTESVLKALSNIVYDGSTNLHSVLDELSRLTLKDPEKKVIICLFTDKNPNTNQSLTSIPSILYPIYIFSDALPENMPLARKLARDSGGAVFDITAMNRKGIIGRMALQIHPLKDIEYDEGRITDVFWRTDDESTGFVTVCGKLLKDSALLTLRTGTYRLSQFRMAEPGPETGDIIRAFWAQLLIDDLSAFPEANRSALIEAGKFYGLVTPHTSLLVLETLQQYVRYRVEPPESLKGMRKKYKEQVEAQAAWLRDWEEESLLLASEQIISLSRRYKKWWEQGNPVQETESYYIKDKVYPPKEIPESGGGCFVAGTPILTDAGTKPIEKIKEGEEVYSWDVRSSTWVLQRVDNTSVHSYRGDVVTVHMGGSQIKTTGNHPFWVVKGIQLESRPSARDVSEKDRTAAEGGRWVEARDLQIGDILISRVRGEIPIDRIETTYEDATVYNLTVPRLNTYSVQGPGIAVHNKGGKEESDEEPEQKPGEELRHAKFQITVKSWSASPSYLEKLKDMSITKAYQIYLEQKGEWAASPVFYLDCAEWFFTAGDHQLGLRIISNIFEYGYFDPVILRSAAYFLEAYGEPENSKQFIKRLLELDPNNFYTIRHLALIEAKLKNYDACLELLSRVVNDFWWSKDWHEPPDSDGDEGFGGVRLAALIEYARIRSLMEREGVEITEYMPVEIPAENLDVDIRIVLEWSKEDYAGGLLVIEPGGEKAYYYNTRTNAGGLVTPVNYSSPGPDVYHIKNAVKGEYRIKFINHAGYRRDGYGPMVVKASIYTNFGRPNETLKEVVVRAPDEIEVVDLAEITR